MESLSATLVSARIEPWQGMIVEMMLGFILLITVLGSTDERYGPKPMAPIAIGFAVGLDILAAVRNKKKYFKNNTSSGVAG